MTEIRANNYSGTVDWKAYLKAGKASQNEKVEEKGGILGAETENLVMSETGEVIQNMNGVAGGPGKIPTLEAPTQVDGQISEKLENLMVKLDQQGNELDDETLEEVKQFVDGLLADIEKCMEEIQNPQKNPNVQNNGTDLDVPEDNPFSGRDANKPLLSIYTMMAMLLLVLQKLKDAARDIRKSENEAIQTSIKNQVSEMKTAALVGAIIGGIICGLQAIGSFVSFCKAKNNLKAEHNLMNKNHLPQMANDMKTVNETNQSNQARLDQVEARINELGQNPANGNQDVKANNQPENMQEKLNEINENKSELKGDNPLDDKKYEVGEEDKKIYDDLSQLDDKDDIQNINDNKSELKGNNPLDDKKYEVGKEDKDVYDKLSAIDDSDDIQNINDNQNKVKLNNSVVEEKEIEFDQMKVDDERLNSFKKLDDKSIENDKEDIIKLEDSKSHLNIDNVNNNNSQKNIINNEENSFLDKSISIQENNKLNNLEKNSQIKLEDSELSSKLEDSKQNIKSDGLNESNEKNVIKHDKEVVIEKEEELIDNKNESSVASGEEEEIIKNKDVIKKDAESIQNDDKDVIKKDEDVIKKDDEAVKNEDDVLEDEQQKRIRHDELREKDVDEMDLDELKEEAKNLKQDIKDGKANLDHIQRNFRIAGDAMQSTEDYRQIQKTKARVELFNQLSSTIGQMGMNITKGITDHMQADAQGMTAKQKDEEEKLNMSRDMYQNDQAGIEAVFKLFQGVISIENQTMLDAIRS